MLNPFSHRRILKNGLPGTASMVSRGVMDRESSVFNLPMTLQVFVEGLAPYEVEDQWWVKGRDAIGLSGTIPVRVDRDDPTRVAIDWAAARTHHAAHVTARRAALAAQGPVGQSPAAEPALDIRNDPDLRHKLEAVLGYELIPGTSLEVADPAQQVRIMQVIQEHRAGRSAPAPPTPPPTDDLIARLERLAALRASGALTDEEFEAQKRRLLETA